MTALDGAVNPWEMTQPLLIFESGLQPGWQWPATDPPDAIAADDSATVEFHRPPLTVDQLQEVLDCLRAL